MPIMRHKATIDGGGTFFAGGDYNPTDAEDMVRYLNELAGEYGCISDLCIVAHGGVSMPKIKKFGGSTGRLKIGKELGLDALRMSLARVKFCKPCSIVLDACKIGNQENDGQLQGIADSTGCKVSALAGLGFAFGDVAVGLRGRRVFTPK